MTVWYVALGSALGGACRYLLSSFLQARTDGFPYGTLLVNVTGSFALGLLLRYALSTATLVPGARAFLTTGFCGGYTTLSTFSYEALALLRGGQVQRAGWYVLGTVILALGATLAGSAVADELMGLGE